LKRRTPTTTDDLGRPAEGNKLSPVWKRWKISYAACLTDFVKRAQHLHGLREAQRSAPTLLPESPDE
jgi:hypothetical protein